MFGLTAAIAAAQSESQNQQFAKSLVHNVLHAKTGDIVLITADSSHMALVEDIVTQLRSVGAFGIADIGSNREGKLYYQYVPAKYDSQAPQDLLHLAAIANSIINIDYPNDPSVTQGVPAERIAALNNAFLPFTAYTLKHSIPTIDIGNGLMPAAESAMQFGVSQDQLSRLFWSGVNTDYGQLHRAALTMSMASNGSHTIHITSPNGTNFTFRTVANSAVMNDGTFSQANRRKGGAAVSKQLPAGDVYFLPVAGSASGTIVYGAVRFFGTPVTNLRVRFTNGKVVSMTAQRGADAVRKYYEKSTAGRDEFAWADFGVNRAMHVGPGMWGPGPSMAAGYVTAGFGNNLALGGSIRSSFGFASNIPNATVSVESTKVVVDGQLSPSFERLTMTQH